MRHVFGRQAFFRHAFVGGGPFWRHAVLDTRFFKNTHFLRHTFILGDTHALRRSLFETSDFGNTFVKIHVTFFLRRFYFETRLFGGAFFLRHAIGCEHAVGCGHAAFGKTCLFGTLHACVRAALSGKHTYMYMLRVHTCSIRTYNL